MNSQVALWPDSGRGTWGSQFYPQALAARQVAWGQGQGICPTISFTVLFVPRNVPCNVSANAKAISGLLKSLLVLLVLARNQIHFGHDVDPWDFQVDHGRHSRQYTAFQRSANADLKGRGVGYSPKELVLVFHELRLDQVDGTCPYAHLLEMLDECRQERMMRIKFYSTRAIEDEVVIIVAAQFLIEPVHILE